MVDGEKNTQEFINAGWSLDHIFIQKEKEELISLYKGKPIELVSENEMERMSAHQNAPPIMATFNIPKGKSAPSTNKSTLILDNLNNPGNLGTIIRIADWYGIEQILVGGQTVDEFNPKVIAASMGSSSRVMIYRVEIIDFINSFKGEVFAAHMQGQSLSSLKEVKFLFALIMGNESHGVDSHFINHEKVKTITIQRIGKAESLNVAVAAGIMLQGLTAYAK